MGWGSATGIFDAAVDVALSYAPKVPAAAFSNEGVVPAVLREAIVRDMYKKVEWDDWDTQDESKYYDVLIHIMHEDGHLDSDTYG